MTAIETLDQWHALAAELHRAGYMLYQMQYSASQPEGFHIWFWLSGRPRVHLVTHSGDVERAMVKYKKPQAPE